MEFISSELTGSYFEDGQGHQVSFEAEEDDSETEDPFCDITQVIRLSLRFPPTNSKTPMFIKIDPDALCQVSSNSYTISPNSHCHLLMYHVKQKPHTPPNSLKSITQAPIVMQLHSPAPIDTPHPVGQQ